MSKTSKEEILNNLSAKNITVEQYEELGADTEMKDYSKVSERIMENYGLLKPLLLQIIEISKQVDVLKKTLIYGKTGVDLSSLPDALPVSSGEKQKAAQMARLVHGIIGLTTEPGEMAEAVVKAIESNEALDEVNMIEEVGDVLWYQNLVLDCVKSNFKEAMASNINKLNKKRYKNGFTESAALNRDLAAERDELEKRGK